MTTKAAQHTAGALKAAKVIDQYWRDNFHETPSESEMAYVISRATGDADLLEALEALTDICSRYAAGTIALQNALAALAKARSQK